MLELYEVRLGKFCAQDRTYYSVRYEYDLESSKDARCLKIGNDFLDINTLEQYHMLRRDNNGVTLDPTEEIELNKYYAVAATPCSKSVYEEFKSMLIENKLNKDVKVKTKKPQNKK